MTALCEAAPSLPKLRNLSLNANKSITDVGAASLARALRARHFNALERLGVDFCGLTKTGETDLRPIQFIGVERKGTRFGLPSQPIFQRGTFRLPVPIHLDFSSIKSDKIVVEGLLLFGRKSDDPSYVVQFSIDSLTY